MELLEAEHHDISALLALVDELYEPQPSAHAPRRRRRHKQADTSSRAELLAQVEQLQRSLEQLRRSRDSAKKTELALLWAHVAQHQRRLRDAAVRENTLLKNAAQRQRAMARRVATAATEQIRSLTSSHATKSHVSPSSEAIALLTKRLDAACERLSTRRLPAIEREAHEHHIQLNQAQSVLRFHLRSSDRYPFKLSNVAGAAWDLMRGPKPARTLAPDEIFRANATFSLHNWMGFVEAHGPRMVRRVYAHDGSVIVVSVSSLVGSASGTSDNLIAGLTMHETMWVRMARADASNPWSAVAVEIMGEVDIVPTFDRELTNHQSDHCPPARLRQLHAFVESYAADNRRCGDLQKLENRLVDESLVRGRHGSPLFSKRSEELGSMRS